jgi:hypothetical protein
MKKLIVILIALGLSVCERTWATHIVAASITYELISDTDLTYEFTIIALQDENSPVLFGDGFLEFGDGRSVNVLYEETETFVTTDNFGPRQDLVLFEITIRHTYNQPGVYTVSYIEPNRNDEIQNINFGNSVFTKFALQCMLVIDPLFGPNSSPVFNNLPYDEAAVGKMFTHNGWAEDPDGDSLSYRLVYPLQDRGLQVPNYQLPNDPSFYSDFNIGNEGRGGTPEFFIDPITGVLVWDAPGDLMSNSFGTFGEFTASYVVEEWREINGEWQNIGYVTRDMMIIVYPATSGRPDFSLPPSLVYQTDQPINVEISFSDPEARDIKVETFGSLFDDPNPVVVSSLSNDYVSSPFNATLEWTPQANQNSSRPYLLHFRVSNQVDPTEKSLVTYRTLVLSNGPLPQIEAPDIEMPLTTAVTNSYFDPTTGLFDGSKTQKAKLFPNPVFDQLNFELDNDLLQIRELSIYNSLGQRTKWVLNPSYLITSVSVSDLPPEFYVLEVRTRRGIYSGKFVKN